MEKAICKKNWEGRFLEFTKDNVYFVVNCNKWYRVYDERMMWTSLQTVGVIDEKWKYENYFYTPEETKNILRTKLIERMLNVD